MGCYVSTLERIAHNQRIYNQIRILQEKINQCKSLQGRFTQQKGKLSSSDSKTEAAHKAGTATQIGEEIVVTDIYEGVTSVIVQGKKGTAVSDMSSNVSSISSLGGAIENQVSKIDVRINELEQQIAELRSQLW